ncbi:hypothetical protein I6I18_07230 [Kytococcus sedentarius]|uniref:Tat pathway signal sequence domain protein n=1 Tax=Kytococcus sedentarius (strain ATCC 14392 / DSM 20547 / JCM 11482 / CCUG 33030 / NBRC 15357 / NCTC 11040 / CCM 314 / 541) TaxID=478801 RepID=C7NJW9_KYTSD|nr:hypothetical protein [Kytococcus sedentarius]ACV06901.1 hypothetical protein Ksed_19000 [Kytococcus sedentarius DSM 20547]QQB62913.1 hypothetical protein I6I18_07230 [Kytococcus sedentarius]STX14274.1 Uncharacterised protein [Kytococcus sedentarius]
MTSNTTTRRTVLRGAAWTAPAVVVAGSAPALAASTDPCEPTPVTVDWESANYVRVSPYEGYYTIPLSDGSTMQLDIRAKFENMRPNGERTTDDQLKLSTFDIGGTGEPGLILHQNDFGHRRLNGYQTVTFTFDRTLTTLDFQITDIDWNPDDFRDAVRPGSNLVATPQDTLEVTRSGFYRPKVTGATDNDSGDNNLKLHGEQITEFTVEYANHDRGYDPKEDRAQRVFFTDFELTVPPIGCP